MAKIPYKSFIRTMTMFFINEEIDKKYFSLRKEKMNVLRSQLNNIDTREGLTQYICKYEDSLNNLLVLLGVSTEYFKRVISLFRIELGMVFSTEWDLHHVRKYAMSNVSMMEKLCDLFLEGPNNPVLSQLIPYYKLSNFLINANVMNRIQNDDFMDFLISKDFDASYNSDVSQSITGEIDKSLKSICDEKGLELRQIGAFDSAGNGTQQIQVNYAISKKSIELPLYYIKYSFNVTTSKAQTDFKRSVQNLRAFIKEKNPDAKQIVIVDGAGWVGRQSDLRGVWDYCDYCLNLKNIEDINNIIE